MENYSTSCQSYPLILSRSCCECYRTSPQTNPTQRIKLTSRGRLSDQPGFEFKILIPLPLSMLSPLPPLLKSSSSRCIPFIKLTSQSLSSILKIQFDFSAFNQFLRRVIDGIVCIACTVDKPQNSIETICLTLPSNSKLFNWFWWFCGNVILFSVLLCCMIVNK